MEQTLTGNENIGKSRDWCFTFNNYTEDQVTLLIAQFTNERVRYYVFGREIGESGTPHLQGYVVMKSPRAFNGVKKEYIAGIHWERRKGSHEQARDYCKKGEQSHAEWAEFGAKGPNWGLNAVVTEAGDEPKMGARTDLVQMRDMITSGTSVDEILMTNPMAYHQYGRTLIKIEDIALRKKYRNFMTKGVWIWGPTGSGKSHYAYKGKHLYDPETTYTYPNDNGWWDGYTGQHTVIINDFRGEIPYNELLQLVDEYPFHVRRRCREPAPFISKKVIITCSLPPESVYNKRNAKDSIAQLQRRFKIKHTQTYVPQDEVPDEDGGNTSYNLVKGLERNAGDGGVILDPPSDSFYDSVIHDNNSGDSCSIPTFSGLPASGYRKRIQATTHY